MRFLGKFKQIKNPMRKYSSAIEYNKLENVNKLNRCQNHFINNIKNDSFFIEKIFPIIKKNIDDYDLRILDVGCGSGVLVNKLINEKICNFVYGCDFSEEKINKCKEFYNFNNFFVHNIYDPLNDFYDVIICTEVLEHLEYPEEAIENLLRSIKVTGKLIISVPDGRKDSFLGHIHFWSPESFRIFINKCLNHNQERQYVLGFHHISDKIICVISKMSR